MSQLVRNINQWNGEQDTEYIWPAWCYDTWIWIDNRRNPPFIKSSPAMVEEYTYWDSICLHKNLEDFWLSGQLVCLDDWRVYVWSTLKFTINTWTSAWNRVLWVGYISDVSWTSYLYFISDTSIGTGKIHRVPTTIASHTASYLTYTTEWSVILDKIPVINETTRFIFWVNNKVFEVDNQEVITNYITFPNNQEMVAITEFQNRYTLYYNTISTSPIHWYQAYWDWFSYEIEWNPIIRYWYPTLAVVNAWAYDYAISWFNENYSDLYLVAGSQWQPIAINPEAKLNSRKFYPYISIRAWMVYISWEKLWVKWVYTYGDYHIWFPKSLTMEFVESVTWTNTFLHHTHTSTKSYFSTDDDRVLSISYNDPPANYVNNTLVYSKYYIWNWLHTLKSIDYMYVWYQLPSASYSIKIYARKDTWSFKLLSTITDHTKEWLLIEASEFSGVDLWDFYKLQFKFELIWPTNPTNTPKIWIVQVFMNDNYNK